MTTKAQLEEQLQRANKRIQELTGMVGLSKTDERIFLEYDAIIQQLLAAGEMVCSTVNPELVAPLATAIKRYTEWESMQ